MCTEMPSQSGHNGDNRHATESQAILLRVNLRLLRTSVDALPPLVAGWPGACAGAGSLLKVLGYEATDPANHVFGIGNQDLDRPPIMPFSVLRLDPACWGRRRQQPFAHIPRSSRHGSTDLIRLG
jgi:hypothetical protein